MAEPIITIYNHHGEGCEEPPHFEKEPSYFGYFVNRHNEQWVFECTEGAYTLRGGDCGWETTYSTAGELGSLVLNLPERFWLLACLAAVGEAVLGQKLTEQWTAFDKLVASYRKP